MPVKVLALAGSTRRDSYNKKLARIAADAAQQAGAEVTFIDLHEFPLPLYDGDLEHREGLPDNAKTLRNIFRSHEALIIASPEYNASVSAVLKNALDWLSRPQPNEPPRACFVNKVAALLSASTGGLGGVRGLTHLRMILGNLQVLVLPDQKSIPHAAKAFDDQGQLVDAEQQRAVEAIAIKLVRFTHALRGACG